MDLILSPCQLQGDIQIIPSKSQAHRLLICAAFAGGTTRLLCPETSRDMEATAQCLQALGARILRTGSGYTVTPIERIPAMAVLPCGESGSTLRFLLPVVGALGVDATFLLAGRLPQRPLSPLWEEMERMGCGLSRPSWDTIRCQGRLQPGNFTIAGNISSQYISGLLLAMPLMNGASHICVTGALESAPYVDMTRQALAHFGIVTDGLHMTPGQKLRSPGLLTVEGDWSNAAFFLAAAFLGSRVSVLGLNEDSAQGDRQILPLLRALSAGEGTISARDIPDLIPILSVFAACSHGAVFTHIRRLRLKESDRVASTLSMILALGGRAEADDDTLTIHGTGLTGGIVDACNDHRIAMSAAIASTRCEEPVVILGAEAVEKSYPHFWEEFQSLGGHYEQYLR